VGGQVPGSDTSAEVKAAISHPIHPEDLSVGRVAIGGFAGEVLGAQDPGYDRGRRLWNVMIDKRPAAIARCTSTTDVVRALAHARNAGLEVAVRGGGHSVAGHSCTSGGMMIDLQPMNRVVVDPVSRRARVQGGALLRHFDGATHEHGLATTGGMVHHTGVAGLTLGGGYGWLARRHALACDNLISAEVVTAGGEIVTASEQQNPDLFWGIRGGGGNFGIVTEFEFRLHPIGPVLSVQLRYQAGDAREVLRAYRDIMASAPPELCGLAGMAAGRGTGSLEDSSAAGNEVYVWYTYAGPDLDQGEGLGRPLRAAARPVAQHREIMAYPDLQAATGDASGPGRRHYWKGSLVWDLSDAFLDAFAERGWVTVGGCGIELFSLGGAISRVGEDDTAYSNRGAGFDFLAAATWGDARDDDDHIAITRDHWNALTGFTRSVYVNDLGPDANARVREAYGPSKHQRLVALKRRWDPDNVFRLNANVSPDGANPPASKT
jgi:FAD/FMN-containing dehydrogenase